MLAAAPLAPAAVAKAAPAAPTLLVNGFDQYGAPFIERCRHTSYGLGYAITIEDYQALKNWDASENFRLLKALETPAWPG